MVEVLAGLRVLDFGRFIAAPWCGALLADMGADVIRVEKREGGEDRWVQPVAPGGEGGTFLECNRNKRSLMLDSTTPQGGAIARKLIATSDVVLANMPDAAMRANGLDYETLKAVKPDIILGSATAYGRGGPYSDRVGFDGVGQVMSGGVYRSGPPEMPVKAFTPYVDFSTALTLTIGVMMALFHRNETGEGQAVEAALLPTALMMTNGMIIEQALLQLNRTRVGNRGIAIAPCDLFKCDDQWLLVQVTGQPMFNRWCRLVEREEWIDDSRFANDAIRGRHHEVLNGRMQDWFSKRTYAEAVAELDAARIPVSPVHSPQQALDDPHVRAMGFFKAVAYPGLDRPVPIIETPFRLSRTPGSIRMRPPVLGEHTDEILSGLGYGLEEIAQLRSDGVI